MCLACKLIETIAAFPFIHRPLHTHLYSCRHAVDPCLPSFLLPEQPMPPALGQKAPYGALGGGERSTRSGRGVSGGGRRTGGGLICCTLGFISRSFATQLRMRSISRRTDHRFHPRAQTSTAFRRSSPRFTICCATPHLMKKWVFLFFMFVLVHVFLHVVPAFPFFLLVSASAHIM